jgi:hypothetical protein
MRTAVRRASRQATTIRPPAMDGYVSVPLPTVADVLTATQASGPSSGEVKTRRLRRVVWRKQQREPPEKDHHIEERFGGILLIPEPFFFRWMSSKRCLACMLDSGDVAGYAGSFTAFAVTQVTGNIPAAGHDACVEHEAPRNPELSAMNTNVAMKTLASLCIATGLFFGTLTHFAVVDQAPQSVGRLPVSVHSVSAHGMTVPTAHIRTAQVAD